MMGKKKRIMAERAAANDECQRLLKNPNVKKALDAEIKQVLEREVENIIADNLASVLYALRQEFGFGKKRLERFVRSYDKHVDGLREHYQMWDSNEDTVFLAKRELERIGVHVEDHIKIV